MGIAKAQLGFNDVLPEVKDKVLKCIEEEKGYLANEKWLNDVTSGDYQTYYDKNYAGR